MSAGPVLVVKVQGEAGALALTDVLRGWRMSSPDRGGWRTVRVRDDYAHVRQLADLLRIRYSLSCCRCPICAAQINTGRDCMGELPQAVGPALQTIAREMRTAAARHRARNRHGRAVELEQFARQVEGVAHG